MANHEPTTDEPTVWIVTCRPAHEGSDIYGVFSTADAAKAALPGVNWNGPFTDGSFEGYYPTAHTTPYWLTPHTLDDTPAADDPPATGDFEVSVTNTFDAADPVDAARQFVDWIALNAHRTGVTVTTPSGDHVFVDAEDI